MYCKFLRVVKAAPVPAFPYKGYWRGGAVMMGNLSQQNIRIRLTQAFLPYLSSWVLTTLEENRHLYCPIWQPEEFLSRQCLSQGIQNVAMVGVL